MEMNDDIMLNLLCLRTSYPGGDSRVKGEGMLFVSHNRSVNYRFLLSTQGVKNRTPVFSGS